MGLSEMSGPHKDYLSRVSLSNCPPLEDSVATHACHSSSVREATRMSGFEGDILRFDAVVEFFDLAHVGDVQSPKYGCGWGTVRCIAMAKLDLWIRLLEG